MQRSTQKRIGKVRPPRVQITYDVETGGAVAQKTLPLVVGVVADLACGSASQGSLRDRSFVTIDTENFDAVMAAMSPRLQLSVTNRLDTEQRKLAVDLTFRELDAFTPAGVARSVPAIAKLLQTRAKLNDLLAKLEGNEPLNDLLAEVVNDAAVRDQAFKEIGVLDNTTPTGDPAASGQLLPSKEA